MISPSNYGGIISFKNQNIHYLGNLTQEKQGILYQMEVTCLETPNRGDLRFILSREANYIWGQVPKSEGHEYLDVISSYEWKKGKRIIELDKYKYDWDYEIETYYLYLAREVENKNYQDIGEIQLKGKFFIKWRAVAVF